MTVALVVTIKVKPGTGADFEQAFAALQSAVRANEPGVHQYELFRGADDTYVILEQYADDAALAAHGASAHFKELSPKLGPFMDGRPEMKRGLVKVS